MTRRNRTRYTIVYCDLCGTRYPDYQTHTHTRAETIAYRCARIEAECKWGSNVDNPSPEDRALIREYATLVTEWWALPKSEISISAALASPSRKRRITAKGNIR